MAKQYGVSLTTLRSAVDLLEQRGLVRSAHGLGAFAQSSEPGNDILKVLLSVDRPPEDWTLLLKLNVSATQRDYHIVPPRNGRGSRLIVCLQPIRNRTATPPHHLSLHQPCRRKLTIGHQAISPPSITSSVPVTHADSSDARYKIP